MNKRSLKKINKVKIHKEGLRNIYIINNILLNIKKSFRIVNKKFFSNYFIYQFPQNSVCHFSLKEFPNWLFAIWLTEKGFSIFGEYVLLIDKFKPSASYISFDNETNSFVNELNLILNKDISHEEYLQEITDILISNQKANEYDFKVISSVRNFVNNFNKDNNKIRLVISKQKWAFHKYFIEIEYPSKRFFLSKEQEYNLYIDLSKSIYFNKSFVSENFSKNDIYVKFNFLTRDLISEEEFFYKKTLYSWDNYKTFKDYIERRSL